MERLRYVARAGPVPMVPLVAEAAAALAYFADDPMGLLTSCRRLLDRRPDCGPLAWLAARMVRGVDPRAEARTAVQALESDPTAGELRDAFPAGAAVLAVGECEAVEAALQDRPDLQRLERLDPDEPQSVAAVDVVVLSSECAGPSRALVETDAARVAAAARDAGVPVWLVTGVGRMLPERMWDLLTARHRPDVQSMRGLTVLDVERFVTKVVTPSGLRTAAEAARRSDCPVVPELFGP